MVEQRFCKAKVWGFESSLRLIKIKHMEVKDFQNKIIEYDDKWDRKRKSVPNEQTVFNHLVEEVGELARQYVNREMRKDQYDEKEIEDAIGDMLVLLVRLADLRGLDIEEVISNVIKEGEKRLGE